MSYPFDLDYFDGDGEDENDLCHTYSGSYEWVNPGGARRSPMSHPYSFDDYWLWRTDTRGSQAEYSDRMYHWDSEAWKRARATLAKSAGPISQWTQRQCSRFLSEYFGKPVTATGLVRSCNRASGSEIMIFYYRDRGKKPKRA